MAVRKATVTNTAMEAIVPASQVASWNALPCQELNMQASHFRSVKWSAVFPSDSYCDPHHLSGRLLRLENTDIL